MSRKHISGVMLILLALGMSLLTLDAVVKQAKAVANPWEMPAVYMQTTASKFQATKLRLELCIYNLSNHFYPTDEEWVPGGPLGAYVSGPVARYNYSLGNLYGFDISISWNPAVLSYSAHAPRVPYPDNPDGILNKPFLLVVNDVDAPAGTYRISYTSNYPAAPFNAEERSVHVFTMIFDVLSSGDKGLSIDSVSLAVDPVRFPLAQPQIPWKSVVLEPHVTHNVGIEAAMLNKRITGGQFDTNVLVINSGDSSETFSLTAYAGTTSVGTKSVTVPARSSQIATVTCNPGSLAKGTYNMKVNATHVSGESYFDDNQLPCGSILITLAGDVDGNKGVNIFDIVKMAGVYGVNDNNIRYDPYCDLDNNGQINIFDIVLAAGNYGKSWT